MRLAGRYELERRLGRGGMAEVWQARHLALDSNVAIKVLHPGVVVDETMRKRFLTEAQITARLRTRYAVQVFDFGISEDGQPFLAMELLEGETLASRLRARGTLSPRATATFLSQAARALDRAHALGIVHRDFKPENLFIVSDDDGGEQIKVVDFGIAKLLGGLEVAAPTEPGGAAALAVEGPLAFATLTRTGARVGTPHYMAPEQVDGVASVDRAVDVWALGVVAFECVTGRRPFEGPDAVALFTHIRAGEHPPARALNAALPESFDLWFDRACARDPSRRFPGAGDAAHALRPALGLGDAVVLDDEDDDARGPVDVPRTGGPATTIASGATEVKAATGDDALARTAIRKTRLGRITIAGLSVALLVGSVGTLSRGLKRVEGAPSSSAAPPRAPTPISADPSAAAAYTAGLQAWRDGSSNAGLRSMQAAVKLDPGLAGASLRAGLWQVLPRLVMVGSVGTDVGRAEYADAKSHRGSADPYDRDLIDAFEPRFRPEPDVAETEHRLEAVAERYRDRGEPLYWVATIKGERGDKDGAAAVIARASAVEPELRPALLALHAWVLGTADPQASTRLDECVALAPSAADCLGERALFRGLDGRCEAMEADAHAWISADGEDRLAYVALGEALFARGAPVEGLRDAFDATERHSSGDERAIWKTSHAMQIPLASGDLTAALVSARAFEESLGSSPNIAVRFFATSCVADLAIEAGQGSVARDSIVDFIRRAPAWTAASPVDHAMLVTVLRYARHIGAISPSEFVRQREAALAAAESMLPGTSESTRRKTWIFAYGGYVETADEARAAIAAIDHYAPLPAPEALQSANAALTGSVFLAAGDLERAIGYLRRGATTCLMLNGIPTVLRARVGLAKALAATGQRDEARALLRSVLDRWDHPTPRSLTVERARAALAALGP